VPEAIATLEKAMQQGSVKAAVELLKIVQLHGQVHPPNRSPHLVAFRSHDRLDPRNPEYPRREPRYTERCLLRHVDLPSK
jgi:hypothetical protein